MLFSLANSSQSRNLICFILKTGCFEGQEQPGDGEKCKEGKIGLSGHVWLALLSFCCRYEQSEWGWKEREKREEMNDERAWYLLARDADSAPVAFSHFRFDVECGEEVLYW